MKTKITILLTITAILCLAQSNNFTLMNTLLPPPYDGRIPPPVSLGTAYNKAVLALGAATNQFHCVSATCLNHLTSLGSSEGEFHFGWTFVFLDTNGAPKNVYVYFDKVSTAMIEDPSRIGR